MNGNYADLATLLARGFGQRRMYPGGHPNVARCAKDFVTLLDRLLGQEGKTSLQLGVVDGKLIHDGRYLVGSTVVGRRLTAFAAQLDAGGFEFDSYLEADEMVRFFGLAAGSDRKLGSLETSRELLASAGIERIRLLPPYRDQEAGTQETTIRPDEAPRDIEALLGIYQSMFAAVETAHALAEKGRDLDIAAARAVGENLVVASRTNSTDIMSLVNYPDCDTYTVGHSVRVCMLTILVGRAAGLPDHLLNELGAAALLHDVGKGGIPQDLLFKPGPLEAEERRIVETHPAVGAGMLMDSQDASPLTVAIAWGHHRRHDGGGYPDMPSGEATGELTRLVQVCDVFEALTAIRPYKRALTPRHAFEIMLSDREAYSPLAMRSLVQAVGLFPPGQSVLLGDGRTAVVTHANRDIERPCVRLSHGADGAPLPKSEALEIDLSADPAAPAISRLLIGS